LNLPWFGVVVPGRVYRSGSPRAAAHFQHVLDLGIKTLICVRYGGPSRQLREFAAVHGLALHVYDLDHDGSYDLPAASGAAKAALDPAAQPTLVCCDGGRHHAGVVVALLRLESGYSLEQAIAEYLSFAAPSPFADNVLFIVRAAQELHALAP
jgi:protein tyrosine/serine phosphatase